MFLAAIDTIVVVNLSLFLSRKKLSARTNVTVVNPTLERAILPPLLGGEGWGEGERNSKLSMDCTAVLNAFALLCIMSIARMLFPPLCKRCRPRKLPP